MKISVIVPTYNEIENITDLVAQLLALPLNLHVIVVDDNSPDGTGDAVDKLAAADNRISCIHRAGKLGLGTAYIAGFKKALNDGADLIITMDADFSHDPKYIPAMVELAKTNHVVIGSRYVPGGGVENWGKNRKFLSGFANHTSRTLLGLHAYDCTAGFRCYHREVLETLDLDSIFSNGYSFLTETAYKCQRMGCSFGETPIIFTNRTRGTSKISKQEIYKAMYTVARLTASRLRFWQRPTTRIAPLK